MILEADEVLIYDNSYEKTNPTLLFQKFNEGETNSEPVFIMWDVDERNKGLGNRAYIGAFE